MLEKVTAEAGLDGRCGPSARRIDFVEDFAIHVRRSSSDELLGLGPDPASVDVPAWSDDMMAEKR